MKSQVASTTRRIMHSAMETADVDAMRRQLGREVDLLAGKFIALGMSADGMTMFTQAAARMMAASAAPPSNLP